MTKNDNRVGVALGVITRGTVSVKWMQHMDKLRAFHPIGMIWKYIVIEDDTGWAKNRIQVVKEAQKQNFEWLLFIDDDVFVPKDIMQTMLQHRKDIVTGIYWTKTKAENPVIFEKEGGGPMYDFPIGKLFKVAGSGLGCCLINMKVFDEFDKAGIPYFKENWIMETEGGQSIKCPIGEDHYFFHHARKLGFDIWADGNSLCDHYDVHSKTFYPTEDVVKKICGSKLKDEGREDIIKEHDIISGNDPNKKTIVFVNHTMNSFSGDELEKRGVGGSEGDIINLSKLFAKDFNTHVFCSGTTEGIYNGVHYHDLIKNIDRMKPLKPDLLVLSRSTDILGNTDFKEKYGAKKVCLWAHDMPKDPVWNRIKDAYKNIDVIFALTDYHKRIIKEAYPFIEEDKLFVARNGIDPERFKDRNKIEKVRGRLIYSSTPFRGLEILAEVFPEIKRRVPHATLKVFSSMKVYGELYDDNEYKYIYEKLKNTEGVEYCGTVKQDELAKEYMKAEVLAYPNTYDETCCLVGDTKVAIPGGFKYIRDIRADDVVYGYSHKKKKLAFGKVKKQWLARKNAPVYKVNYKWGIGRNTKKKGSIIGTSEHLVLMKDGNYREIGDLKKGDKVMPFYRSKEGKGKYITLNLNNGKRCYEHDFIGLELLNAIVEKGKHIIHHKDKNGLNNNLKNLESKTQSAHAYDHINLLTEKEKKKRNKQISVSLKKYLEDPVKRKKWSDTQKRRWKNMSSENRKKFLEKRKKAMTPDIIKKQVKRLLKANEVRKVIIDEKILRKKYLDEQKSMIQIARELKTSDGSIKKNLQKYGIPIRNRSESQLIRQNHKIESIEFYGYEDVYDIEVSDIHNFVANDIVVHNCITAFEAQSAGTPIVTSDKGALPETAPNDVAIRIKGNPYSIEYKAQFVDEVVNLLTDREKWTKMHKACLEKDYSWETIYKEWVNEFFSEEKQDPDDIKQVGNINTEEYWDKVYENELDTDHIRSNKTLINYLKKNFNGGKYLDVGCGTGEITREMRKEFPNAEIWGSDFSIKGIDFCRQKDKTIYYANHPLLNKDYEKNYFDLITMNHLIEHLDKPVEVIERAKELLKKDGKLILVVPINDDEWHEHLKIWHLNDIEELMRNFNCEYSIIHRKREYVHTDGRPFEEAIITIEFKEEV